MAFLSRPFAKDERAAKAARRKEGRDCVTAGWRILRESSEPITTAASDSLQISNATAIFKRPSSVNRGFVLNRCRRYNRAHLRLFHRSAQKLQLGNIVGNKNVASLNAEPNGFCARLDSSRYFKNVVGLVGDCVVLTRRRGTARRGI